MKRRHRAVWYLSQVPVAAMGVLGAMERRRGAPGDVLGTVGCLHLSNSVLTTAVLFPGT